MPPNDAGYEAIVQELTCSVSAGEVHGPSGCTAAEAESKDQRSGLTFVACSLLHEQLSVDTISSLID